MPLLPVIAGLPPVAVARPASSLGVRLSDERTFTRSATAYASAVVRAEPADGARPVGRLHRVTEDGFAETYLLLRSWRDHSGRTWIRLRLPARPNGQTGWVPRDALGPSRLTHVALVVDRRRLRATLLVDGRRRWSAPVGVGKPRTPTPGGHFWVREQFRPPAATIYGAYAFGTAAYARISDWPGGGVVGIHGTDQPRLVPGRPSHGCVRMRNRDVLWLARRLPDGAPVTIR